MSRFVVARGMMVTPGRTHFHPPVAGEMPAADPRHDPEFREWFKESVIVDADGCPLRMYHGSPHDFERFDVEKLPEADPDAPVGGFWFAADRSTANYGRFVKEFYLSIQRPADYFQAAQAYRDVMKRGDVPNVRAVQAELMDRGFDGYAHNRLMTFRPEEVARWKALVEQGEAVEYRPGMSPSVKRNTAASRTTAGTKEGDHHVTGYENLEELLAADTASTGIYVAFSPDQIMPTSTMRVAAAPAIPEVSVEPYLLAALPPAQEALSL